MANKLKVLAYSDGPTTTTGFGRVAREVLKSVHSTGKYDITSIGINYFGITPEKPSEDSSSSDKDIYNAYVNYQLIPASAGKGTDPYGRRLFLEALEKSDFDIVWILQDLFNLTDITPSIIELKKKKKFKVILYFPIDTQYVHDYFLDATKMADAVVVYNKWTNKLLTSMRGDELKDRLCTIYHGYNPEDFFPLNSKEMEAERKRIFGNKVTMDDILIVRSDSNQQRKDWFKTLQIVGGVAKSSKRVKFYANTTVNNYDFPLFDLAKRVGLTPGENFIYQSEFTKTNNLTQKDLNVLYNVADLGISTSRGEGCFVAGTMVRTSTGYKKIEEITPEDRVMTATGQFLKVHKVHKRKYKDKLYRIKTTGRQPIVCTKEHPFYTISKSERAKWKPANELHPQDLLFDIAQQDYQKEKDSILIDNNFFVTKGNTKFIHPILKPLPKEIAITPEFAFIAGMFIGDGVADVNGLRFCLSTKKSVHIPRIENYFKEALGLTIKTKTQDRNRVLVSVYSKGLGLVFRDLFGHSAKGKKIPAFLLNSSPEIKASLIEGLWKSDGYVGLKNEYSTISKNLAYSLMAILADVGIQGCLTHHLRDNGNTEYKVRGGFPVEAEKILKENTRLLVPCKIQKIEEFEGNCNVYNLTIENTTDNINNSSYIVNGILVHNCGLLHYEMMAIGKDVLISHNSAHEEAIEAKAAIPLYCGKISTDPLAEFDPDYLDVLPNDLGMQRPVCSVSNGIERLESFCKGFDRDNSLNLKGFAFMKNLTWNKIGLKWIDLFDKVAKQKEPYIHEEKVSHSILQEYVARVQNSMDDLNRKWKQEFGIEPPSLNFTGEENEKKKNNIIIP